MQQLVKMLSDTLSSAQIKDDLSCLVVQDLVEVLSDKEAWLTPRKVDQATFERKSDGSFAGFERTPPFEYHNGYLTVRPGFFICIASMQAGC